MQSNITFNLSRQAWLIALISTAYSASSYAAAGKVEFSLGDVSALGTDGRSRALSKGSEINAGDTIQTSNGRAQVRFTDGGYISLQPNTEFKVEDYAFSGKADGSEKGFFSLVKGGLRAITGAIGHGTNKTAYRVSTPVATIGIRGTEYTATQQQGGGLNFHVGDGAIFVESEGGNKTFYQGQNGEVSGSGSTPQHTTETPNIGAAGPNNPQQQQEEQQQAQQNQQTFIAGDIKTDDGGVCSTTSSNTGGCGFLQGGSSFNMASEIDNLKSQEVSASFYGSGMSGSYGYVIDANVNFATYGASLDNGKICAGDCSASGVNYIYGSSSTGGLDSSTGKITFTGVSGGGTGSWSGGSVTSASGQLDSIAGLPSATFTLSGTTNGSTPISVTTGSISRSAGEGL